MLAQPSIIPTSETWDITLDSRMALKSGYKARIQRICRMLVEPNINI
jgi:hypothetical protein